MTAPPRLLVTGSRAWTDEWFIASALSAAWGQLAQADRPAPVLVHGACPTGADEIAARLWTQAGYVDEAHPADWRTHGRAAGPLRNQHMVDRGADLCLAFIVAGSRGASHTARIAKRSGIETWRFEFAAGEPTRCVPEHGVHSAPHRGCLLR